MHLSSESLYESTELPAETRDAAALLASKVYYYLGEYDEALSFALGAGSAFETETRVAGSEEYVETVVCKYFGFTWRVYLTLFQLRPLIAMSS
jgi:hypothetical protein